MTYDDTPPDISNPCPMCKGYRHIKNSAGYVSCRFCAGTGKGDRHDPPEPPKKKRKGTR